MNGIKFTPKYDKIVELLLYLAHVRPCADHYQAVKFLYLSDKEHMSRYGRPITFEKYCALPYGPVASNALDLIKQGQSKAVLNRFSIEEVPFEVEKLDNIFYIRAPKRAVNHSVFSKSDLKVFDEIIKEYGHRTFSELYYLTHSHFAYKTAWENRGSKKSVPIRYEDMMDETSIKASYLDEIADISEYM